ncbi:MAG: prepilin-type N-terminal cleavage/methylation domain-containing protein [Stellaceae bacterium]
MPTRIMPGAAGSRQFQRGFTLIEVIVVLAILSALTAIAYAYSAPLTARVRAAFERDDFERQLLELPLRVRDSGHGGILTSRSGENLPEGTPLPVEGKAASDPLEEWQVLRIDVAKPWRLLVPRPIYYHASGACEGGEVEFLLPPVTLRYVLTPPLCRPLYDNAAQTR